MAHESKLTVYTIGLNKQKNTPFDTNRWLFRNKIGQANTIPIDNSVLFMDVFKKFIEALDTQKMYTEPTSKKCMTANQNNIQEEDVEPNIIPHSEKYIIEGKIEGGSYGRKRKKTSTVNKTQKSEVGVIDAITDDFYFLLYSPLAYNKSILMVHSYSDDSIDSVMKRFFGNFFSHPSSFNKAHINRFIPKSIIDDFKDQATVSSMTFSTEILGETLIDEVSSVNEQMYKVTVQIEPTDRNLTMTQFNESIEKIQLAKLNSISLGQFKNKKATLNDRITKKDSPFELDSLFEIQPTIILSKYKELNNDENDFPLIREFCFELLEDIKLEIYPEDGIQER